MRWLWVTSGDWNFWIRVLLMWVWLDFVASGGHWVLWLEGVAGFSGGKWVLWLEVVAGFSGR